MESRLGKGKGGGGRAAGPDRIVAAVADLDMAVAGVTGEPVELAEAMRAVVIQLAKVNLVLHVLRSRVAAGVPPAQVDTADAELEAILDGLGEAELLATEVRRRLDQAMSAGRLRHLGVAEIDRARPAGKPGRGQPGAT